MALTATQNVGLSDTASSQTTSTICEPTAAANDKQLFITGNWFAYLSN